MSYLDTAAGRFIDAIRRRYFKSDQTIQVQIRAVSSGRLMVDDNDRWQVFPNYPCGEPPYIRTVEIPAPYCITSHTEDISYGTYTE